MVVDEGMEITGTSSRDIPKVQIMERRVRLVRQRKEKQLYPFLGWRGKGEGNEHSKRRILLLSNWS